MKRVLALVGVVVLVMSLVPMTVLANHSGTGTVSATVTPAFLSVTVTEQFVGYGALDLGVVNAKPTGQTGSTNALAAFQVNNNGTVTANWAILGIGSTAWAIAEIAGTDTYAQRFDITADGSGNVTTGTSLHTSASASSLASAVTTGNSVFVWLQLDMPTHSGATAEQSLPITVTATASS